MLDETFVGLAGAVGFYGNVAALVLFGAIMTTLAQAQTWAPALARGVRSETRRRH